MAKILQLNTFSSDKGSLTVFEKILSGNIKRLFYIYGVKEQERGGHRHKMAWNALTCVNGHCKVYVHDGVDETTYQLDSPDKCLVLEPKDWHQMFEFSEDAVLLVMSNEFYDKDDYVYERYEKQLVIA